MVVECDAGQPKDAKACLEKTMVEGMDTVIDGTGKASVPVEARVVNSWGKEAISHVQRQDIDVPLAASVNE